MLVALALLAYLQATPTDAPKTKLGLPADTRPIGEVADQMFPDPPGFKGAPFSVADAIDRDCRMAKSYIDLAARLKRAKLEGDIGTGGRWKELSPDDIRYIDLRLLDVEAKVEKHKLGCSRRG